MATVTAGRGNPVLRPVFRRLVAAGTPKQVALVAGRRTLLTVLDAPLTHQTPWAG